MKNVILIGMPGCGKSTVGRLLAEDMSRPFLDADTEFERMHGMTPAAAIQALGEESFRQMEHQTLCELGKKSGAVIACGGGVVTREDNYAPLHQNGVILFLERDLEKLATDGRPLSQNCSIHELWRRREAGYRRFADLTVTGTEQPTKTALAMKEAFLAYNHTCVWKRR
jgi:shikimate dehydrogenase